MLIVTHRGKTEVQQLAICSNLLTLISITKLFVFLYKVELKYEKYTIKCLKIYSKYNSKNKLLKTEIALKKKKNLHVLRSYQLSDTMALILNCFIWLIWELTYLKLQRKIKDKQCASFPCPHHKLQFSDLMKYNFPFYMWTFGQLSNCGLLRALVILVI